MRFVRYLNSAGQIHAGSSQPDGTIRRITGDIYGCYVVTADVAPPVRLLAPVVPSQILCIGLNYRQHAIETGAKIPEYPILFAKGVNTLAGPGDVILLPRATRSDKVDYECELAVVSGRQAKNVSRARALDYALGYTCGNDVSARDWQLEWGGGQWCRGKPFDTFCPLDPVLVTTDEIRDPNALRISTLLNGERVQDSTTFDMIFDVPALIEFLSRSTTLPASIVILTGTPQGVGRAAKPLPRWLRPGDTVAVEIEKIGTLINQVEVES
jgi:2-keto-4-pentenoate hydratase/2-oxohepta-3-ene-1,7-dioic acid hydratase in catechol pathway